LAHGNVAPLSLTPLSTLAAGIEQGAESDFTERGSNARAADLFITEAHVGFEAAGEEEWILRTMPNSAAQLVHVVAANIHAIEENRPR
jgi:hypothetical protein